MCLQSCRGTHDKRPPCCCAGGQWLSGWLWLMNKSGALSLEGKCCKCMVVAAWAINGICIWQHNGPSRWQLSVGCAIFAEMLEGTHLQQQSCSACRQMTLARQPPAGFRLSRGCLADCSSCKASKHSW